MTGAGNPIATRATERRHCARRLAAATAGTILIALAPAASAGASGASGAPAKTVSPASWSRQACQTLVSYERDVAKLEKSFTAKLKHPKTLEDIKSKFSAFLGDVAGRTDKLLASLRSVGDPKVSNGPQVSSAIQNGFLQLRDDFHSLFTESQQIPTTDPTAFRAALGTLQTNLTQAESQNQAFFHRASQFDSPELSQAFKHESACRPLKGR